MKKRHYVAVAALVASAMVGCSGTKEVKYYRTESCQSGYDRIGWHRFLPLCMWWVDEEQSVDG